MNNQQKEEQLKLLILENKVSEIKNLISSNIDLISYIQINLNDILLITQDNNSEKLLSYILKTFLHDSMAKIDSAMNHAIINSNGFWLITFLIFFHIV